MTPAEAEAARRKRQDDEIAAEILRFVTFLRYRLHKEHR